MQGKNPAPAPAPESRVASSAPTEANKPNQPITKEDLEKQYAKNILAVWSGAQPAEVLLRGIGVVDVNSTAMAGQLTALLAAAQSGTPKIINALVEAKANVNYAQRSGSLYTAVHLAALNNKAENIECLLAHKADVNAVNKKRNTALLAAATNGGLDAAKVLFSAGLVNVNEWDEMGDTLLTWVLDRLVNYSNASRTTERESLRKFADFLIKNGADVNALRGHGAGYPILYGYVKDNKLEAVDFLIKNGANFNLKFDKFSDKRGILDWVPPGADELRAYLQKKLDITAPLAPMPSSSSAKGDSKAGENRVAAPATEAKNPIRLTTEQANEGAVATDKGENTAPVGNHPRANRTPGRGIAFASSVGNSGKSQVTKSKDDKCNEMVAAISRMRFDRTEAEVNAIFEEFKKLGLFEKVAKRGVVER